jgi:hypothetical protein
MAALFVQFDRRSSKKRFDRSLNPLLDPVTGDSPAEIVPSNFRLVVPQVFPHRDSLKAERPEDGLFAHFPATMIRDGLPHLFQVFGNGWSLGLQLVFIECWQL